MAGARLWRELVADYSWRPDELRLLFDACGEVDLIDRLADALADAPLTVRGSQGQQVASPLVTELRQHRTALVGLLKALRFDENAPSAADISASARHAARARWDRRGPRASA